MGNFHDEQKKMERAEQKRDRRMEKNAGVCFDIAKLCFGGMVIGAFVPLFSDEASPIRWWLALAGILSTLSFIYAGNQFLK